MNRKDFLKIISVTPLIGSSMKLKALEKITQTFEPTEKMPALFLGHGSPMNAIEENQFVLEFKNLGKNLSQPKAILCISAHWETKGTYVTAMSQPKTIHDFGGFPQALFDVQYPAPGSPELAKETQNIVHSTQIELDEQWGLDHGAWSVIKHLYPEANIPVIQMSIDYSKPPRFHYELAKEISILRKKGILIIGSGNMVHNLRMVAWSKLQENSYAFDWATEANESMKAFILNSNHQQLIDFNTHGKPYQLAIPTAEHYIPLLYIMGLKDKTDEISIFNDAIVGGSISMTSVKFE